MVADVRARGPGKPSPEDLADLLSARGERDVMSPDETRRLSADVLSQAQHVSYLLGKLAELMEPGGGDE